MNHYNLRPVNGWRYDQLNLSVSEAIYRAFSPLVNEGEWSYMNFISAHGIFTDANGNSVEMFFDELDVEDAEVEYLQSVRCCFSKGVDGFMPEKMQEIEKKYQLIRFDK